MSKLILIVEDEKNICELIRLYVEKEGYETCAAYDGDTAVKIFKEKKPDIVILDIMLPKKDGWQVCREIRAVDNTPIIMLTAKGELFDKVLGLELGADDYMVKPFEPKELVARVKAVLRRGANLTEKDNEENKQILKFEGLVINRETYEVYLEGQLLDMPPKEFELLYFLASNPNRVFSRDQILDEVWGYEYYVGTRTIDVHIKRIREKIEPVERENPSWLLRTIWSVGYKFEVKA